MRTDAHALLAAYAADAVDDDERRDVEFHVDSCPTCTEDLVGMRETLALLADAVVESPPLAMRATVLAAAAATPQTRPAGRRDTRLPGQRVAVGQRPAVGQQRRSPLLFALAASLAVLTVLGAATTGLLWQRLSDARDERSGTAAILAAADSQVLRVTAELPPELVAEPGSGDVVVVVSAASDSAAIVTSGLPAAPDGWTWQSWILTEGGARSAGLIEPAGGVAKLDGSVADAVAVAVSLEPEGGSAAPTTDPVAVLALPA